MPPLGNRPDRGRSSGVWIVRVADQPVVPWRNGGGSTSEIARWPSDGATGGAFAWRASSAIVASDGPFSDFRGIHRSLVLLDGPGLVLRFADREITLAAGSVEVASFDGGEPCHGATMGGPVRDLNWMVAGPDRGTLVGATGPTRVTGVVVVAAGPVEVALDGELVRLELGDAWVAPERASVDVTSGRVWVCDVEPACS